MRLRASLWLLLALITALTCGLAFQGKNPVQTDLLALLPLTERNPVAERAVEKLSHSLGNRVVFLIGHRTGGKAHAAAREFAASLRESNAFSQVTLDLPNLNMAQLMRPYLEHRFMLLTREDAALLATPAPDLAERLQSRIYSPFQFGIALPLEQDPFGFTGNWLRNLPLGQDALQMEEGQLVAHDETHTWVFVTASLAGSAYDEALQRKLTAAVEQGEHMLKSRFPDAQLLRTGTVFYAEAARTQAEKEFHLIGSVSLVGMLLLLYLVFRSIWPLALGLFTVAFGIAAAIAGTLWIDGSIHVITLVFGASLIGEAIDYAIQYFAVHINEGEHWEPMQGLRKVAPGLGIALATSLLGYGALMLSPFPALAQIALFAIIGLSAAWVSVFLLLPTFLRKPVRSPMTRAIALPRAMLKWWQRHLSRKSCLLLMAALLLIAAPGWFNLKANDDIRILMARPADLMAQEERIRHLTGFGNGSQFFLVEGRTPEELLRREEQLTDRLAMLEKQGILTSHQSVSAFVPSQERQAENHARWQQSVFNDPDKLRAMLDAQGLRENIGPDLEQAFAASNNRFLTLESWLAAPVSAALRHLWMGKTEQGYASIVFPRGASDLNILAQAGANLPGISWVDKPASVSREFQHYREWGSVWLIGALGLIYLILSFRYGWRQAGFTLLPTLLAMALALGIFGWLGWPLTLFNLMGLMLVLGVGVNYAVFLREGNLRAPATFAGVLLSAGTTLISFGMLAFSSMPALAGFGMMLLVGIGIAVSLAPIVLTFSPETE